MLMAIVSKRSHRPWLAGLFALLLVAGAAFAVGS